jgi:hypothetical protein
MLDDMPQVTVQVSQDVADALGRQAHALQLGRRQYVRSLLAAAAGYTENASVRTVAHINSPPEQHFGRTARQHGENCCCWQYSASLPTATVEALNRQAADLFLSRGLYVDELLTAVARASGGADADRLALAEGEQPEVEESPSAA